MTYSCHDWTLDMKYSIRTVGVAPHLRGTTSCVSPQEEEETCNSRGCQLWMAPYLKNH